MSNDVKIDGVKLKIGTEEYIVPPLNFKALKKLTNETKIISRKIDGNVPETVEQSSERRDAMISYIHHALLRNYSDIKRDELEDMLDVKNMRVVFAAVMGSSGFVVDEKKVSEIPDTSTPSQSP